MSDAEGATHPALPPEVERRLEAQRDGLAAAHDAIEELQAEIQSLRDENDCLRERLADVEDRTDLQAHVQDAAALKVEDRAKVCIQTCVNEAQRRGRNGENASATMDYNEARKALGGGLADQQLLDALKRADDLVDSPAVRFKKETRAAQRNSRLIVDLEAGDLPAQYRNGRNRQPLGVSDDV